MKQATTTLIPAAQLVVMLCGSSIILGAVTAFIPTASKYTPNPILHQQHQHQQSSCSPRYVAVDRHFSNDVDEDSKSDYSRPSSHSLDHVQSLWVFVHSLQRERREQRASLSSSIASPQQSVDPPVHADDDAVNQEAISSSEPKKKRNPAKSLANFLSNNKFKLMDDGDGDDAQDNNGIQVVPKEVEPFSRAVVQAIRLASELGDYKLIIHLVEASIQFANQHPIIMPRVFGEAIDGISKTPANMAKMKLLWNLGRSEESKDFLTESLGTFELNVMIKALASRGKIRAALTLYHETTNQQESLILPDPYTLSSIFSALEESITDNQATKLHNTTRLRVVVDTDDTTITTQSSQCWQWNDAMNMFTSYMSRRRDATASNNPPISHLNNHVFASLLKLNERVSEVYKHSAHNAPKMALYLLNTMHQIDLSPDAVTCTLIISNLGYQWKTAVNLHYAMKTTPQNNNGGAESVLWKLPRPNVFTYSAVIKICAHSHQYQAAMELLQEMKHDDDMDSPNTWVYNAALLATTRSDSLAVLQQQQNAAAPKQKRSQERLAMAMKLLREMQEDASNTCRPDTVTYNTVLATLDGIASPAEVGAESVLTGNENLFTSYFNGEPESFLETRSFEEGGVHSLLDEMESTGVLRDSITYRNALLAVRFSNTIRMSVWRVLDRAILDQEALGLVRTPAASRQLGGKAADGVTFVFNTAMTVLASHGDVEGVLLTFEKMLQQTTSDREQTPLMEKIGAAQIHFLQAVGHASDSGSSLIPVFLSAMKPDNCDDKLVIQKEYPTMDERLLADTTDNESLYAAAISSCLAANDIDNARKVLGMMKKEGLKPSELSLQEIARTYARLAVFTIDDAFNTTATTQESTKVDSTPQQEPEVQSGRNATAAIQQTTLAVTRAKNAFTIATKVLVDPPASLLSTIARTCATLGMWKEASFVLRKLHRRIPGEASDLSDLGSVGAAQTVLPGVHRALLRAASIQGNVTAALWYAEDIQELSRRMAKSAAKQRDNEDQLLVQPGDNVNAMYRKDQSPLLSADLSLEPFSMVGEDWKLLMIAASKCGHWRVCLNTLQFLRPFLEETHPSSLGITVEERSRRYGHLAPALTVAVKCLEIRSQYAWAVRAIDDWMEWSGRRPPKAAVLAAIRVLSARGRGNEVLALSARCTMDGGLAMVSYPNLDENYEMVLYVGAITALHNEGMYDDADDAFIAAVNGKFLPFELYSQTLDDGKQQIVLDLHGMNVPVAHSAVRVALQQKVETASWNTKQLLKRPSSSHGDALSLPWQEDMVIVTGRGRHSALRMRPVLRPEVQRMLLEEFYPPLSTTSMPGNMGAVRIPSTDMRAWLAHQRQQKGSRMLAVASVLRSAGSVDRIRQSIALKLEVVEQAGTGSPSDDKTEQKDETHAE